MSEEKGKPLEMWPWGASTKCIKNKDGKYAVYVLYFLLLGGLCGA